MATSSIYRPGSVEESYNKIFSPINTGVQGGRAYSDAINVNSSQGKLSLQDQLDQAALDLAKLNLASASQVPSSYDAQKAQLDLLATQQANAANQLSYLGEQQRQQQALQSSQLAARSAELEQQKFGLSKKESRTQQKQARLSARGQRQQIGLAASAEARAADAAALAKAQGQQQMQLDALASQRAGEQLAMQQKSAALSNQQAILQNNALKSQQIGIIDPAVYNSQAKYSATMPAWAQQNAQRSLSQGYPIQAAYSTAFAGGPQPGMAGYTNPEILKSQQQNAYRYNTNIASQGLNPQIATDSMYRAIGVAPAASKSGTMPTYMRNPGYV